jgi:polar amino acid transport system substrate-binding protein
MDIDIAKAIAKGLFNDETKVEFVQQASDSRIPNIVSGKVDITCQFMTVTATRAQQVAFTNPYYREGVGLLLKKGGKYKNYAALLKAGSAARISILQNVTADAYVKAALPKAKVLQYAETALIYTAVDANRADAAAADQSAIAWLVANNPTKYVDSGYGWLPQTYSCALKQGDQVWLNFVNQVLNESMSGVDFDAYSASFKKWFGVTLPPPKIGFPR